MSYLKKQDMILWINQVYAMFTRKQGLFKVIPKIHKRLLSNYSFTWSRTLSTMRLMLVLE